MGIRPTLDDARRSVLELSERYRASGLGGEQDPMGAVAGRLLRCLSYLGLILDRVETGWATTTQLMGELHQAITDDPLDEAGEALFVRQNAALEQTQLDLESFSVFAKIALDALPPIVGVVIGHTNRVKTSSFNDLRKTLANLAGQVSLPPPDHLAAALEVAYDEVILFRDKSVVHRRKQNEVQGISWNGDGQPRLQFITVYPRSESDAGHAGTPPRQAIPPIAAAVCATVAYLDTLLEHRLRQEGD